MKSITLLLVLGEMSLNQIYNFIWCSFLSGLAQGKSRYLGQYIGPITDKVATVEGEVFAVDKSSIILTNFTHDGSDPGKQNTRIYLHKNADPYLYEGTFIYAGTLNPDGSYTKTGYPLTDVHGV